MNEKLLLAKLGECLSEDMKNVDSDTELKELEGWDSLGRLMIVSMVGEMFHKQIETSDMIGCSKIGDIVNLVKDKIKA